MPEPITLSNLDTKEVLLLGGAAGAVIAACVSAAFVAFNGWRQRVADKKRHRLDTEAASSRHFRELALQAALAEWNRQNDAVEKWSALDESVKDRTDPPDLDSLDLLLVEKLALLQQFGAGDLSPEELRKRISGYSNISKSLRGDRT